MHPTSDVRPGYTESSVKLAGRERGNRADQQVTEKDVTKPVSQAQEPGLCISYQGNGLGTVGAFCLKTMTRAALARIKHRQFPARATRH